VSLADSLAWVLRVMGVLYLVGGLWGARSAYLWARIEAGVGALETRPASQSAFDPGRYWWVFAGALITAAAGAAMALAVRAALWLLALTVVHQLFYFLRQRRRERAAASRDIAADARPAPATIRGYFSSLVMLVLAAWLYAEGALD